MKTNDRSELIEKIEQFDEIWLIAGDTYEAYPYDPNSNEYTWADQSIFEFDVNYIRSDLFSRTDPKNRRNRRAYPTRLYLSAENETNEEGEDGRFYRLSRELDTDIEYRFRYHLPLCEKRMTEKG